MSEIKMLEWLFGSEQTFLFTMTFITMLATFASTKQLRASILMAILTLVYGSYTGNEYFTGLMYIVIVVIALLVANQLYGFIIGSENAGEQI